MLTCISGLSVFNYTLTDPNHQDTSYFIVGGCLNLVCKSDKNVVISDKTGKTIRDESNTILFFSIQLDHTWMGQLLCLDSASAATIEINHMRCK